MGYVLVKGKKGDEVADTTTIFASPSCHSVVRRGKTNEPQDNQKSVVNAQEIQRAIRNEIENVDPELPGLGGTLLKATGGSSLINLDDEALDAITFSTTKETISDALSFSGHTQAPILPEVTETETFMQRKLRELEETTAKLENVKFPVSSVYSLAKWFDDMEAVIDSLPTMSEDGGTVYVVEKNKDGKWLYTGDSEPMDREWNAKIQAAKAVICDWLQTQMNKVTSEVEAKLQEHLNRMDSCGPFTRVISVIQKVPSLTTIIDWAKGIIDFVVGIYKMIYNLYKMTIQLLEIVIIRFPQLVNKFMQKVTEYDCPLSANISISVNKK